MAVTPETIAVALGRTAPAPFSAEAAQWEMWVGDALMLIEDRLKDRFALLDQAKLNYVVREAVVAHIRKPDDAAQVDIQIDDGRISKRYESSKGRVRILDEWWDLLDPAKASGAFTLDMVGTGTRHLPWCSLMFGATYCSCGVDIAGEPIFELGGY